MHRDPPKGGHNIHPFLDIYDHKIGIFVLFFRGILIYVTKCSYDAVWGTKSCI